MRACTMDQYDTKPLACSTADALAFASASRFAAKADPYAPGSDGAVAVDGGAWAGVGIMAGVAPWATGAVTILPYISGAGSGATTASLEAADAGAGAVGVVVTGTGAVVPSALSLCPSVDALVP